MRDPVTRSMRAVTAGLVLAALAASGVTAVQARPGDRPNGHSKLVVMPMRATVEQGATVQFSAASRDRSSVTVEWFVGNVKGGNASVGTITGRGLYTAPSGPDAPPQVTVMALPPRGLPASARVTIVPRLPVITEVMPSSVATGNVSLTITGKFFDPSCKARLDGVEMATTFVSSTQLTATGSTSAAPGTSVSLDVLRPGPPAQNSKAWRIAVIPPASSVVNVTPLTVEVPAGSEQVFAAEIPGSPDHPFTWWVNGVKGGNATTGTIDEYGKYTGPDLPPANRVVTITATTYDPPYRSGNATVTITNPIPVIGAIFPYGVHPGAFKVSLAGRGFMPTSQAFYAGRPLTVTYVDPRRLDVTGTAAAADGRSVAITVANPAPGPRTSDPYALPLLSEPGTTYRATLEEAGRLLEQASFGPNTPTLDRVRTLGVEGWLDEQFALPESTYTEPPVTTKTNSDSLSVEYVMRSFTKNALTGDDQLRQRVMFALSQVFVVSANKVDNGRALFEWQKLLSRNAFGTYRGLLEAVTLSPAMGHYLDLANSEKPTADGSVAANENYPREIMQLFSIGLVKLNPDGSVQRDTEGNALPTYTQDDVKELALAMTGWGYPTKPGSTARWPTKQYFVGPMVSYDEFHDRTEKRFLGGLVIPAGGTARSDMTAALDGLAAHPNVGPFMAIRLIHSLVKSNPSPEYVARVAAVFADNGHGVRGDLKAVVKAVLMDDEARHPATGNATDGKLREPMLYLSTVLRALDGQLQPTKGLKGWETREMAQRVLEPPSVFNYFSPLYRVGADHVPAPEFQIYTPIASVARENFMFAYLNESFRKQIMLNLEPFGLAAGQPATLVDMVDTTFFFGRMSSELKAKLVSTITAQTDNVGRRRMSALYLALTSGEYLIQH